MTTDSLLEAKTNSLINESDNLDVVRGAHKLDTSQSTRGDETSAMSRLSSRGNFLTLGFGNNGVRLRGGPETEVFTDR